MWQDTPRLFQFPVNIAHPGGAPFSQRTLARDSASQGEEEPAARATASGTATGDLLASHCVTIALTLVFAFGLTKRDAFSFMVVVCRYLLKYIDGAKTGLAPWIERRPAN